MFSRPSFFCVRIETLKKNYWVSTWFVIGGSTEEVSMFEGREWPTIPKKKGVLLAV